MENNYDIRVVREWKGGKTIQLFENGAAQFGFSVDLNRNETFENVDGEYQEVQLPWSINWPGIGSVRVEELEKFQAVLEFARLILLEENAKLTN